MKHFLELCCNRVPVDAEGTATALYSVLRSLASCPEAVGSWSRSRLRLTSTRPSTLSLRVHPRRSRRPHAYDDFLPYIHEQIMDWDPPETTNQDPMATVTPMGALLPGGS